MSILHLMRPASLLIRAAGLFRLLAAGFLSRLLAFAFGGTYCVCCGRPALFRPLCRECTEEHFLGGLKSDSVRCHICGRLLVGEHAVCMACRRDAMFTALDGVFPLYPYRLWYKNLLFSWKMEGERSLSPVFAAAVHKALGFLYEQAAVPCLVPVPPRPGKIRRKGWDQVDELCRLLAVRYGYRVERLLVRQSGGQQKKKGFGERRDMRGVYGPSRRFTQLKRRDIIPTEVVLVDDLITSGSTVAACAAVLKAGYIEKVKVLSLFIVD